MVTIYMKNDILSLKRDGMSNRKIALKLNISKDIIGIITHWDIKDYIHK